MYIALTHTGTRAVLDWEEDVCRRQHLHYVDRDPRWALPPNRCAVPVHGDGFCIAAAAVGQEDAAATFDLMLDAIDANHDYFGPRIPGLVDQLERARQSPRAVYHDESMRDLALMM